MDPVGLRVQRLSEPDRVLVVASIATSRGESGAFSAREVNALLDDLGLPGPDRIDSTLTALQRRQLIRRGAGRGVWRLAPLGKARVAELLGDLDLALLAVEASTTGSRLGAAPHPVIHPGLAPPALMDVLPTFLAEHPFEQNVFGMTRFPDVSSDDPVAPALEVAREVCRSHRLEFHLASDRAMHDDLWTNVAAHMWASKYGIAFFEDRLERGMNYNLTIEVGSMLMTGRRCALLRDTSIAQLPTDLVGRIRKDVNLDDLSTVRQALHTWVRDDLALGACAQCPS